MQQGEHWIDQFESGKIKTKKSLQSNISREKKNYLFGGAFSSAQDVRERGGNMGKIMIIKIPIGTCIRIDQPVFYFRSLEYSINHASSNSK